MVNHWLSAQLTRIAQRSGKKNQSSAPPINGGLALNRNKVALPNIEAELPALPMPEHIVIPLLDDKNRTLDPIVRIGDKVAKYDLLAAGILSSSAGTVTALEPRPIIHPSGHEALCVVIECEPDIDSEPALPPQENLTVQRIKRAGLTGMGGAGYSTAKKITALLKHPSQSRILIINAVECEPIISCDESLILSRCNDVIAAVDAMAKLTECNRCIFAIEDDKTQAIRAVRNSLTTQNLSHSIELRTLPAIYPTGAESLLVKQLTGQNIGSKHATDFGVLCINVATTYAARQAQLGCPSTSRVVTVAGSAILRPMNLWVPHGATVADVIRYVISNADTAPVSFAELQIRAGGPFSGIDLDHVNAPVTATTHCILVDYHQPAPVSHPCIRCAACSDACPVGLLPQQLFWHAHGDNAKGAQKFGLDTCIECGCCDVVCPSKIALTHVFRYAKGQALKNQRQTHQAELARQRFDKQQTRRHARQEAKQQQREEKKLKLAERLSHAPQSTRGDSRNHLKAQANLKDLKDPIAGALERSRARRKRRRDNDEQPPPT